jgi:predicted GIY-YIG superfamily endonuclease
MQSFALEPALALQCPAAMAHPNIVYILRSLRDPTRYYTGVSSDVETRLGFHNAGLSSHTADAVPWELVTSITFANAERALEFEKYLKSGSGRSFARRHFR